MNTQTDSLERKRNAEDGKKGVRELKKYIFGILYGILLIAATSYVL